MPHDASDLTLFEPYLETFGLVVDGAPIFTGISHLLPVLQGGMPAMLKILMYDEERKGSELMAWWGGQGAARVLAWEGDGLLLERVIGTRSLPEMARTGRDDEATRIICEAAATLHAPRSLPPPNGLIDLRDWFVPLKLVARTHGGILIHSAETARQLLASSQDIVVLHGDLHHGNVLDGEARSWLAIDPKGLIGERGFDFANIFRNPEHAFGADPARLDRQATVVAKSTGIDRTRILKWILAFAGLSSAWVLGDEEHSASDLAVAEMDLAVAQTAAEALQRL